MKAITVILLLISLFCNAQTNSIVTELYLANNFTPKSGITPGSNNIVAMDCDQITSRYKVTISGVTTTGHRLPSQNQLTDACTRPTGLTEYSIYYGINIDGTYSNFTSTLALAKQACYDQNDQRGRSITLSGKSTEASLLAVDSTLYDLIDTTCTTVSNGYYLMFNGVYFSRVIYVSGGIIQSISDAIEIGDALGGGKIARVFENAFTSSIDGLVASTSDLTSSTWGCQGTSIAGILDASYGFGVANTDTITKYCTTSGIAADVCKSYSSGVFSDWGLPNAAEFLYLINNKTAIGNFSGTEYWTSRQYNADDGYRRNIDTAAESNYAKSNSLPVRAIRYF